LISAAAFAFTGGDALELTVLGQQRQRVVGSPASAFGFPILIDLACGGIAARSDEIQDGVDTAGGKLPAPATAPAALRLTGALRTDGALHSSTATARRSAAPSAAAAALTKQPFDLTQRLIDIVDLLFERAAFG
jgi:hypothetical protein